jgi:hypothetical protein
VLHKFNDLFRGSDHFEDVCKDHGHNCEIEDQLNHVEQEGRNSSNCNVSLLVLLSSKVDYPSHARVDGKTSEE